jgi:pimeloyl-ACP methyl ester carboxylesterase
MQRFDSDGVAIAYLDEGEGDLVVLVHGFASNARVNWVETSWIETLVAAGRRVVALDNRGHGESEKLYDPALYGAPDMAEDVRRLLDHLEIGRADVVGYSMGARICAFLATGHGARVRSVVFGGLGENMVKGVGASGPIAAALEAPSAEAVSDATARSFRLFAERTGGDLKALAACIRGARRRITSEEVAGIAAPVLVVVGENDPIGGSADALAALIPQARALTVPGRDHMTTVGAKAFKEAVLAFLAERP